MAHVLFSRRFIYVPSQDRRCSIVYREGWSGSVRAECARAAVEAGAATRIPTPRRASKPSQ